MIWVLMAVMWFSGFLVGNGIRELELRWQNRKGKDGPDSDKS